MSSARIYPVTLAAWILRDGAVPFPQDGTLVDYQVGFSPAGVNDLPELCVTATVNAEPLSEGGRSGRSMLLHFPEFSARAKFDEFREGEVEVRGRLHVSYGLAPSPIGRLTGTVGRRRLITELREPGAFKQFPTYELTQIESKQVEVHFSDNARDAPAVSGHAKRVEPKGSPAPTPEQRSWRRETGLLVDVEVG